MILYRSVLTKILKIISILLSVVVLGHIVISLIVSNMFFYSTITMITLCLISLIIIVMLVYLVISNTNHTNKLYVLLYDKCDPISVLDKIDLYLKDSLTSKTKINLISIKFTAYFRAGLYKEAKNLLNEFKIEQETKKDMNIILWNNNKIMLSIAMSEENNELRREFNDLKKIYPKKIYIINMYEEAQNKFSNLYNFNFENLISYYEDALVNSKSLLEKVVYNNNLAKIYFKENKEKAKTSIDFVLEHGNTLYAVTQCNNLKNQMEDLYEKNN